MSEDITTVHPVTYEIQAAELHGAFILAVFLTPSKAREYVESHWQNMQQYLSSPLSLEWKSEYFACAEQNGFYSYSFYPTFLIHS